MPSINGASSGLAGRLMLFPLTLPADPARPTLPGRTARPAPPHGDS